MQRYILILIFCFNFTITAQEVQLSWNKDFNIANEIAKVENKPMLVYFTKTDCNACTQFYTAVFMQDTFKNLANNFVLLMLDGSNTDSKTNEIAVIKQRRLVMHYNKPLIFPAILALNSDGQELREIFTSTDESAIDDYFNFLQSLK